jgi:P27 family predicted phage terminase small subunit
VRGRKRIPTVVNIARGNPGRRPINLSEPKPAPLSTECPAELTDPMARIEWERRIVPAIRSGQITSADWALALAHCELYADWRTTWIESEKHGRIITVGKQPQPNPYRSEARRTRAELWKIDAELGFSPVARSRITAVPQNEEEDSIEAAIS